MLSAHTQQEEQAFLCRFSDLSQLRVIAPSSALRCPLPNTNPRRRSKNTFLNNTFHQLDFYFFTRANSTETLTYVSLSLSLSLCLSLSRSLSLSQERVPLTTLQLEAAVVAVEPRG